MSIQSPEREEQAPAARSRSRRSNDYRLRGLDLEAPAFAEAPRAARKKHPSRRRRTRRLLVQWIVVLLVTASVAVAVRAKVAQSFSVTSRSMVPTLQAGTDVLVIKAGRLRGSIKAGNIVVFDAPAGATCRSGGSDAQQMVNRVIGLPGDTIWSAAGSIYVNGTRLDEPGWYNPPFGELGNRGIARTEIPAGSYFVMGDNRADSCDSRSFGPVSESLLVGKVVATVTRNGHLFVHVI